MKQNASCFKKDKFYLVKGEAAMKKLVKSHYKMFFLQGRLLLTFSVSLLIFAITLGYQFSRCAQNPLFYLQKSQEACQLILLVDLFLSFEYIYSMRNSGLWETLQVSKKGQQKSFGAAVLVLLTLVLAQSVLFFVFPVLSALKAGMLSTMAAHITLTVLLNVFLLGFAAVSVGFLLGLISRRVIAYSLIAVLLFLAVSASDLLPGILYDRYKVDLWTLRGIFSGLLPSAQGWTVDYQYGVPIEAYRWCLSLFWILLFFGLGFSYLFQGKRWRRLVLWGVTAATTVFCLAGYWAQGSQVNLTDGPAGIFRGDPQYYRTHMYQEQDADFEISAYEMDLKIGRELDSHIRIHLQGEKEQSELQFTLYHLFEIERIENESQTPLSFQRDGDYFTVTCEELPEYLDITYKGYSNVFYSSHQGVCLPGSFPYYPWAGYRRIHYCSPNPEDDVAQYIFRENERPAHFSVNIQGGRNIVTNLSKSAEGTFQGDSKSLTVMGGFMERREQNGYSFVVCTSCPQDRILNVEYIDALQTELNVLTDGDEKIDLQSYNIFQLPEAMGNRSYGISAGLMGDHIFLNAAGNPQLDAADLLFQKKNGPILDTKELKLSRGMRQYD